MSVVETLNDKQKEAALYIEGPLLILAGAGSGKTRVITNRTAYMIKEKKDGVKIYASLLIAMIVGRIAGGMIQSIILGLGNYSLQMWATAYFVSTFPGIVMHLLVIPPVCMALKKAGIAC